MSQTYERIKPAGVLAVTLAIAMMPLAAQSDAERPSATRLRPTHNFVEAIALPPEKQDGITKAVVAQLAASAVPNMEDASRLALGYVVRGPGLDARDGWTVTGLFWLALPIQDFSAARDLVWEVRIHRIPSELVRILWVSTTTGSVREIFPRPTLVTK